MTGVEILLACGAAARLTRLVVEDTITEPVRVGLVRAASRVSAGVGRLLAGLLGCQWCAGVWVAAGVVAGWWLLPSGVWTVAATVLSVAQAVGMISVWEGSSDE